MQYYIVMWSSAVYCIVVQWYDIIRYHYRKWYDVVYMYVSASYIMIRKFYHPYHAGFEELIKLPAAKISAHNSPCPFAARVDEPIITVNLPLGTVHFFWVSS